MVAFSVYLYHCPLYPLSTEPGEPPCITSAGFQFLLLDTPAQLWYFMLQYLQTAQVRSPGLLAGKLCPSQGPLRGCPCRLCSLMLSPLTFSLPFLPLCFCPFLPRVGAWTLWRFSPSSSSSASLLWAR